MGVMVKNKVARFLWTTVYIVLEGGSPTHAHTARCHRFSHSRCYL